MFNSLINLIIDNSILFFVFLNFLLILFLLNYSINLIDIIEKISLFLQFVLLPVLNRVVQALILLMLLSLMINGTLNTVYLFNYLSDDSFTSTYFDLAEIIKNFNFFGGEKKEVANEDLLVSHSGSTVRPSEIIVQEQLSIPIGKYNKDKTSISVEEVPIFFKGDEKQYHQIIEVIQNKMNTAWGNKKQVDNLRADINQNLHNASKMFLHNYNKNSPNFSVLDMICMGWEIQSYSVTFDKHTIHYDLIKQEDVEKFETFIKTTNISEYFNLFIRKNLLQPNSIIQSGFYANNHPYIGISVVSINEGKAILHLNVGFQCTHGVPEDNELKNNFWLASKQDFLGKERAQYIEKTMRMFNSSTVGIIKFPYKDALTNNSSLITNFNGLDFDDSTQNYTGLKNEYSLMHQHFSKIVSNMKKQGFILNVKCTTLPSSEFSGNIWLDSYTKRSLNVNLLTDFLVSKKIIKK